MGSADLFYEKSLEDSSVTIMARVRGEDGAYIAQASINAIQRKIFDTAVPGTEVDSTALTVPNAVFDTLQTDGRWSVDDTGYNFLDRIPAGLLTTPNRRYRVQYVFTPTAGADDAFSIAGEISTVDML